MKVVVSLLAALACTVLTKVSGYTRVVDLSHTLNEDSYYYPLFNTSFTRTNNLNMSLGGGMFAVANKLLYAEHTGTHMDAPVHFLKPDSDQWYNHEIPPERLVGRLHVLDLAHKAEENPDYEVTVDDIEEYEEIYGRIQPGGIVLLDFDWAKHSDDPEKYFGTSFIKDPTKFIFPGIGLEGAKALADRGISGFGSQCASADMGSSADFGVHVYLLTRNIWLLENVGELGSLPAGGGDTTLTVGVIKTEYGTGGPARLLALVNDVVTGAASSISLSITGLIVIAWTANFFIL